MCYVLTFQDWKGQRYYLYDDDFDHLIEIGLNDEIIQESGCICLGSETKLLLADHLPYEVYLSNVQERKKASRKWIVSSTVFQTRS